METLVETRLSQEQMGQIFRLAGKKVRLAEVENRGGEGAASSLIEENIISLEREIRGFGISPEFLEVAVTECCRAIAVRRIAILLEVRCYGCDNRNHCLYKAPTPLAICTGFSRQKGGHFYDEFGRDKTNVFVAEMLVKKFL